MPTVGAIVTRAPMGRVLALAFAFLWHPSANAAESAGSLRVHAGPAFWQQGTLSCMTDQDVVACSPINFRSLELGASFGRDWFRGQLDGVIGSSPEGGIASYRLIALTVTPDFVLPFGWGDLNAGPRVGLIVLSDFPTDPGPTSHQPGFAGGVELGASLHLGRYLGIEPAASFLLTPLPTRTQMTRRSLGITEPRGGLPRACGCT